MVVYSELSTHQEIVPVNRPCGVAVGVHPKNTDEFSSDRFLFIAELLNLPHMVALGDGRLDRTAPVNNKKQFNVVSTLTRKKEVVVLRLREIVVTRSIGLNMTSVLVAKYGDVSSEQRTMEINVWEIMYGQSANLARNFKFSRGSKDTEFKSRVTFCI